MRTALADLAQRWAQVQKTGRGQLLAVQGRRQVGKSTLLTTFVEAAESPALYLSAVKNAPTTSQLARLREAALDPRARMPGSTQALWLGGAPTSWTDAFTRMSLVARESPLIVVLDEFPWAVERSSTLEGELQVAWDSTLERQPVLFVLIGSDVAMMSRLGDHDRPLFGRAQPLVVPPLNPAELADALPDADAFALFDAYLVTGGYPRLARSCASAGSAESYVRQALTTATSDLVVTARLTLAAEFPDSPAAATVLAAIGANPVATATFNDVLGRITDTPSDVSAKTAITRALTTLRDTKRLIDIEVPAGAPASSKLRRYLITDPYLRFWFAFVQDHEQNISRGRADLALTAFSRSWESWRGRAIEPVVREATLRLAATTPGLRRFESVGAWWNRSGQVEIDLVGRDRRGVTALGTIKWRPRKRLSAAEVAELAATRQLLGADEGASLIGICPAGSRTNTADVVLTAQDLLTAWT